MSTTTQLPASYSPSTVDAITRAFEAVWATLHPHMESENHQAEELKITLSQTLVSLASDGITDWQELRRKALETMARTVR